MTSEMDLMRDLLGKDVRVVGSFNLWEGRIVAYNDGPSLLLEMENGHRLLLPVARSQIEVVE